MQVVALSHPLHRRVMRAASDMARRRPRVAAALTHLALSAIAAAAVAALVFGLWFPPSIWGLTGSTKLFGLVVLVDVVIGPALTLVAFNPTKTRRHLQRDLMVIAALQISALGLGLHAIWRADRW